MKRIIKLIFPANSSRRKVFEQYMKRLGIRRYRIDPMYQLVLDKSNHIQRILPYNLVIKDTPLISIIVPAYNPKKVFFETLVNSVLNQSYENFELIVADGSDDKKVNKYIDNASYYDTRIKKINIKNNGISENTNSAIKLAKGKYVALLDHDDLLHPDALLYIVAAINKYPDGDFFYTDECNISENGDVFKTPHYKPDFSPDLLNNLNYITHFAVIRKEILKKVGLFDKSKDGAQDFDMFLRISEYTQKIHHIPKILYYWRESKSSTASSFENKDGLVHAGTTSLEEHYKRLGVNASVSIRKNTPGFYQAKIHINKKRVGVVIWAPSNQLTNNYLNTLKSSIKTRHNISWLLVNKKPELKNLVATLKADYDTVIVIADLAVPRNQYVFDRLISTVSQTHIGIVGATLTDSFEKVVYKGEVNNDGVSYPLFKGKKYSEKTNFGDVNWDRNVDKISRGILSFETSLIPDGKIFNSVDDLVAHINNNCISSGLYKTVLGRCLVEEVAPDKENFDDLFNNSGFFNANLSEFGYEDFVVNSGLQLPVTNTFNILVDPDE